MSKTEVEIAWKPRISEAAKRGVSKYATEYQDDSEGLQMMVTDHIETMLFDSLDWEPFAATEISDIAYEAAGAAIWAAKVRKIEQELGR